MNASDNQRTCPVCGRSTRERFCPVDRAQSVVTGGYLKKPHNYGVDDVVGDRYRILEKIAQGGFAVVFRAEHVGTGQHVALKLLDIDPSDADWLVGVQRFFREARVTAGLSHPNTVRVFDVGQDAEGALFLTMEYLFGETLEQILRRRVQVGAQLTEQETLDVAIPVLGSLEEAHICGLVHRDLKPGNIMISVDRDGEQQVKVLDFGIARTAGSSLTAGGMIPGTPPFMSPEQCLGHEVDARSDIYALAALLYLCVCGRAPFQDSDMMTVMRAHVLETPADPREYTPSPISDGLVEVLMAGLEKKPDDRLQTAGEMAGRLRRLREEPVSTDTGTELPASPPPASPPPAGAPPGEIPPPPRVGSADIPPAPPRPQPRPRGDSGLNDPVTQVQVLLQMAEQTKDPYRQLQYLQHALELEPRNLRVREKERLARRLMAEARRRFGTGRPNRAQVKVPRGERP